MKQETLEEAAKNNYPEGDVWNVEQAVIRRLAFMKGAKWQSDRMYSKEDVREMLFMALNEPKEICCTTHTKDSIVRKILTTFKSE